MVVKNDAKRIKNRKTTTLLISAVTQVRTRYTPNSVLAVYLLAVLGDCNLEWSQGMIENASGHIQVSDPIYHQYPLLAILKLATYRAREKRYQSP